MRSRVHYTNPQGRPAWKDVTATKQDAAGVFAHLYPGCKVLRVEAVVLRMPAPIIPTLNAATQQGPVLRRASDEEMQKVSTALKAFRQQLHSKHGA